MAYATSPGHPQYTDFIPEIWSGKLIENFYDATVLAAILTPTTKVRFVAWVIRSISVQPPKSHPDLWGQT